VEPARFVRGGSLARDALRCRFGVNARLPVLSAPARAASIIDQLGQQTGFRSGRRQTRFNGTTICSNFIRRQFQSRAAETREAIPG
jgi:hypothetical protein